MTPFLRSTESGTIQESNTLQVRRFATPACVMLRVGGSEASCPLVGAEGGTLVLETQVSLRLGQMVRVALEDDNGEFELCALVSEISVSLPGDRTATCRQVTLKAFGLRGETGERWENWHRREGYPSPPTQVEPLRLDHVEWDLPAVASVLDDDSPVGLSLICSVGAQQDTVEEAPPVFSRERLSVRPPLPVSRARLGSESRPACPPVLRVVGESRPTPPAREPAEYQPRPAPDGPAAYPSGACAEPPAEPQSDESAVRVAVSVPLAPWAVNMNQFFSSRFQHEQFLRARGRRNASGGGRGR